LNSNKKFIVKISIDVLKLTKVIKADIYILFIVIFYN